MLDGYILAFYIAALSELHRYGQHQGSTWLSEDQFGSDRRKTGRGADVATSSLLTRTGPHLCTAAAERTLPYAAIALCTEANGLGWCVPNGIAKTRRGCLNTAIRLQLRPEASRLGFGHARLSQIALYNAFVTLLSGDLEPPLLPRASTSP